MATTFSENISFPSSYGKIVIASIVGLCLLAMYLVIPENMMDSLKGMAQTTATEANVFVQSGAKTFTDNLEIDLESPPF